MRASTWCRPPGRHLRARPRTCRGRAGSRLPGGRLQVDRLAEIERRRRHVRVDGAVPATTAGGRRLAVPVGRRVMLRADARRCFRALIHGAQLAVRRRFRRGDVGGLPRGILARRTRSGSRSTRTAVGARRIDDGLFEGSRGESESTSSGDTSSSPAHAARSTRARRRRCPARAEVARVVHGGGLPAHAPSRRPSPTRARRPSPSRRRMHRRSRRCSGRC